MPLLVGVHVAELVGAKTLFGEGELISSGGKLNGDGSTAIINFYFCFQKMYRNS